MGIQEHCNLQRFIASVDDDGGEGVGRGSLGSNNVGDNEVVSNIAIDNVSTCHGGGAEKIDMASKHYDIFPCYSTTLRTKNAGMATSVVFPFTFAQWKELERQAMIYKYIIASVPVPADLLFPLSRNYSDSSVALAGRGGGIYNVRYSKNGDPEPGRCKRTDGKKWRCSRDVAPHQKYCERHLHRGRPRSRKPVEAKNNGETQKKARLEQSNLPTVSSKVSSQQFAAVYQPQLLHNPKIDPNPFTPNKETDRDSGSVLKSDILTSMVETDVHWQHMIEAQMGLTNETSLVYNFHQDYLEQQSLMSYSYSSNVEVPSVFIDTLLADNLNSSNNDNPESSFSSDSDHRNLSPSLDIPISMAGNSSHHVKDCDYHLSTNARYLCPVSWEPFASGGPLAEALLPTNRRHCLLVDQTAPL